MTPPAATAAGRALPRTVAPRTARRVSGPARPKRDPHRQPKARTAAAPRRAASTAGEPLAIRAIRRGQAMADSRFLARLIGGRLWIPIVAMGLMGIVFMQVTMLSMNASISRTVESASALERQNAKLRADVSTMESGERIDRAAAGLGMVVPQDTDFYVRAGGAEQAAAAAARMTAPDPDAIARVETTAAAPATSTATPVTPTTGATTAPVAATTPQTTAAPSAQQTVTPATQQTAAPATQQTAAPATQQAAAPQTTAAPVTSQQPAATATAGGTAAPGA